MRARISPLLLPKEQATDAGRSKCAALEPHQEAVLEESPNNPDSNKPSLSEASPPALPVATPEESMDGQFSHKVALDDVQVEHVLEVEEPK